MKDFTVVLADSSLNFKLKADSYVVQPPGCSDVDAQTHVLDQGGILMQPLVCYRLSLSAGQYKFTENEELRVSHISLDFRLKSLQNYIRLIDPSFGYVNGIGQKSRGAEHANGIQ